MATPEPIKEERKIKETATRIQYEFEDSEKKIKRLSKEIYPTKNVEIHYPWGFDGNEKYPNVKKFVYEGFGAELPVGVIKVATFGYGFNKKLRFIGDFIGEKLKVETIRIVRGGVPKLDKVKKELVLNENNLRHLYDLFVAKTELHSKELVNLAHQQLQIIFPKNIKDVEIKYVKNSIAEIISTWGNSLKEFSDKDRESIKEMFDRLTLTDNFLTKETLVVTKDKLEKRYIEDVISEFKILMQRTSDSDTTEKRWQKFLNNHSWIFSHLFSFPIILFQDEAYVGGKTLSNKNGKVSDFLVKNNLTQNVAFIEIKTHKTPLLKKGKPYRGSDVFGLSDDLSGAISQVLNQRDNFQKHCAILKMESDEQFETFNSKCVVLMGEIKALEMNQLKSFELIRSNSKDVEINTFDELLSRLESLQTLIQGKATSEKKPKK